MPRKQAHWKKRGKPWKRTSILRRISITLRPPSCTSRGCRVDTIEGLSDSGELKALQKAFHEKNALQCGFCTPGMLMAAQDLVVQKKKCSREEIRSHISGNYCRCTGYQAIVDAIEQVLNGQS